MIALGLAALSALSYGLSDFIGGLKSRHASIIWVTVMNQIAASTCVIVWLVLFRPGHPTPLALGVGTVAGLANVAGTLFLMRGFARGAMHVAGPVSAVVGSTIPVLVGVGLGERPSALAWVGIVLAIPAVWLVASGGEDVPESVGGPGVAAPAGRSHRRHGLSAEGALDGVLAGLGFAIFFIATARGDASAGGWQLGTMEVVSLATLGIIAAVRRPAGRLWDARAGLAQGVTAAAGTITYYLAAQVGLMSLVTVTATLYPAVTVLLAMGFLGERPGRIQLVGLLCSAAAVVLIALGGAS